MDKLQSEYEALQQKLALLKRDSNSRDSKAHQPLPQSTPLASIQAPRLPQHHAAAAAAAAGGSGDAPPSVAEPPSAAPDSTITGAAAARLGSFGGGGDTGPLSFGSMSVLQSCENLQLQCSIPDVGGVLQSLKFQAKHPNSRMAQLAEGSFSDAEFVQLCEQGLTAQLQRTRDGATTQSRIAELAGTHVSVDLHAPLIPLGLCLYDCLQTHDGPWPVQPLLLTSACVCVIDCVLALQPLFFHLCCCSAGQGAEALRARHGRQVQQRGGDVRQGGEGDEPGGRACGRVGVGF